MLFNKWCWNNRIPVWKKDTDIILMSYVIQTVLEFRKEVTGLMRRADVTKALSMEQRGQKAECPG
jgi:hypothetical protein